MFIFMLYTLESNTTGLFLQEENLQDHGIYNCCKYFAMIEIDLKRVSNISKPLYTS